MRNILISLAGLFLFLFMEGFIRLIILFYHRSEFVFYGISDLPGYIWVILILIGSLINSWFSGMLIFTVTNDTLKHQVTSFTIALAVWKFIELWQTYNIEPLWYLILSPLLCLTGIYIAFKLKQ